MLLLRCLSVLAGSIVLCGAPFLLLPETPQGRAIEGPAVLTMSLGVILFAAGFFFVGFVGHRLRRAPHLRAVAAALLAVPIVVCTYVLATGERAEMMPTIGVLLCCTIFLFYSFVFPAIRWRTYRPMRPREPAAHFLRAES